jgi:hypothetical protein
MPYSTIVVPLMEVVQLITNEGPDTLNPTPVMAIAGITNVLSPLYATSE